jgi:hypothetical protein
LVSHVALGARRWDSIRLKSVAQASSGCGEGLKRLRVWGTLYPLCTSEFPAKYRVRDNEQSAAEKPKMSESDIQEAKEWKYIGRTKVGPRGKLSRKSKRGSSLVGSQASLKRRSSRVTWCKA